MPFGRGGAKRKEGVNMKKQKDEAGWANKEHLLRALVRGPLFSVKAL